MIDYLYRKPKFPIICIIDNWLISASSQLIFQHRVAKVTLSPATNYSIIDSIGNDWQLYADEMYIAPTLRRKWSKKKIIQIYNQSRNYGKTDISYSEKLLSSKRFEVIFTDIVKFIEQSQ